MKKSQVKLRSKRLYMEANGRFTIIRQEKPLPGLFVIPKWDNELYNRFQKDESWWLERTAALRKRQPFNTKTFKCTSCGQIARTPTVLANTNE